MKRIIVLCFAIAIALAAIPTQIFAAGAANQIDFIIDSGVQSYKAESEFDTPKLSISKTTNYTATFNGQDRIAVTVTPKAGLIVRDIRVNGVSRNISNNTASFMHNDGSHDVIEITTGFEIKKVNVNNVYETPIVGQKAGTINKATLDTNSNYTITKRAWFDNTDGEWVNDNDTFKSGHEYEYTVFVQCKAGYAFSQNTTATINSGEIKTGPRTCWMTGDDNLTFCIKTKSTKPSSSVSVLSKFTDAPAKTHWSYKGIEYCVENKLFSGISETKFAPNATMSRAMLVTVLYRLAGEPKVDMSSPFITNPFTDLKASWYKNAVIWAVNCGIVNGTSSTTFSPDGAITREQMAAILYRFADWKIYDISARKSLASFPDAKKVSSYAKDAFSWAVANEIINGNSGMLDPKGTATRAQVATILYRLNLKFEN